MFVRFFSSLDPYLFSCSDDDGSGDGGVDDDDVGIINVCNDRNGTTRNCLPYVANDFNSSVVIITNTIKRLESDGTMHHM